MLRDNLPIELKRQLKPTSALGTLYLGLIGMTVFPLLIFFLLPLKILYSKIPFISKIEKSCWKCIKKSNKLDITYENQEEELLSEASQVLKKSERPFDISIVGATGYVGQFLCEYLTKNYGLDKYFKWAIVGRDQDKLDQLFLYLHSIDALMVDITIIVADSSNYDNMKSVANNSKLVISCAGPFSQIGCPLVNCCAAYGTDYIDISTDTAWIDYCKNKFEDLAKKTGARIINGAGFGSVGYDLMVNQIVKRFKNDFAGDKLDKVCFYNEADISDDNFGQSSGKFRDQIQNQLYPIYSDLVCDDQQQENQVFLTKNPKLFYDKSIKSWCGNIQVFNDNSKLIQNTNKIQKYGSFTFEDNFVFADLKYCLRKSLEDCVVQASLSVAPLRFGLQQNEKVPLPGNGPDKDDLKENGFSHLYAIGTSQNDKELRCIMTFDSDPVYIETARIVAETALCLVLNKNDINQNKKGGFWTPVSQLEDVLQERLCKTGSQFEFFDNQDKKTK